LGRPGRGSGPALEQFAEHGIDVGQRGDALHREAAGMGLLQLEVFLPEVLRRAVGDLDVGEVLREFEDLVAEDLAAARRVVVPVVAVRGLGAVDVPQAAGVALETTVPPDSREVKKSSSLTSLATVWWRMKTTSMCS
jgi:hypothetical protein